MTAPLRALRSHAWVFMCLLHVGASLHSLHSSISPDYTLISDQTCWTGSETANSLFHPHQSDISFVEPRPHHIPFHPPPAVRLSRLREIEAGDSWERERERAFLCSCLLSPVSVTGLDSDCITGPGCAWCVIYLKQGRPSQNGCGTTEGCGFCSPKQGLWCEGVGGWNSHRQLDECCSKALIFV